MMYQMIVEAHISAHKTIYFDECISNAGNIVQQIMSMYVPNLCGLGQVYADMGNFSRLY